MANKNNLTDDGIIRLIQKIKSYVMPKTEIEKKFENYYTKEEVKKLLANLPSTPSTADGYSIMSMSDTVSIKTMENKSAVITETMNISLNGIMDGLSENITSK